MSLTNLLANAKTTTWLRDGFTDSEWEAQRVRSAIACEILRERIERGMNQKEFAKFMGVSRAKVSKWESGECNFSINALSRIAVKLDRIVDTFFRGGV